MEIYLLDMLLSNQASTTQITSGEKAQHKMLRLSILGNRLKYKILISDDTDTVGNITEHLRMFFIGGGQFCVGVN